VRLAKLMPAAAFFVTYEALKETLPSLSGTLHASPSLNHLVSASGAEFASVHTLRLMTGIVLDPSADGSCQVSNSGWNLRTRAVVSPFYDHDGTAGWYQRLLPRLRYHHC